MTNRLRNAKVVSFRSKISVRSHRHSSDLSLYPGHQSVDKKLSRDVQQWSYILSQPEQSCITPILTDSGYSSGTQWIHKTWQGNILSSSQLLCVPTRRYLLLWQLLSSRQYSLWRSKERIIYDRCQRILMKGRITEIRIFNRRQCNVTPINWKHCSRLQQYSACHVVIEDWMIPFFCVQRSRDSQRFSIGQTAPKIAPSHGVSGPPSNTWFLGPHESAPKRHLDRFSQFLHSSPSPVSPLWRLPCHTQIHRPRYVRHL